MKTIQLMTVGMLLFFATNATNAQVSINVNLGVQPAWGPAGYSAVDYYYIPDVQCYYDVRATQFIYLNNGVWIRSRNLPSQHRHYDLNRGYKVVLNDYHGSRPYANYRYDCVKYYKGYRGTPQKAIGHRNYSNTNNRGNHDNHGNDYKNYGRDHGNNGNNGRGHGNGNRNKHGR